ncbi:hypothetical protein CC1G_08465 [Coprinopsis cinerea okayama7|uniref:F-box domain-containing protein n=1 Tax=Coprinopsis cinerea (strain Okayama-7 / 130 / ATCC MYA-4618 / FGSC 9003) TaxID=240176 RepID=A8NM12_COPC7|nr:hypothetical protein CC1G_08465 [Coprinopsis cinerea okayama7\|eukprot:XP_001834820.1 hypothetical protein CC1G_08465 [Coprinopsis cinerea okayama7\
MTSASDRFLEVPELKQTVSENLAADNKLGTLANLAGVSAFHHAAIRELWRDIPGLWVISKMFPYGHVEAIQKDDGKRLVIRDFYDIAFESLVARLQHYTPFVNSIRYSPDDPLWEHTALIRLSENPSTPYPLFPNLRRAILPLFNRRPKETIFYTSLVLPPNSVRSIQIVSDDVYEYGPAFLNPDTTGARRWFVRKLVEAATSLTRLGILIRRGRMEPTPEYPIMLLPDFLLNLPSTSPLRCLQISHLDVTGASLRALGRLENLETLTITLSRDSLNDIGPSEQWTYPAMKTLTIMSVLTTTNTCTNFFNDARAPKVSDITILQSVEEDIGLDRMLTAIAHSASPTNLTSITIREIDYETLQPLSPFTRLNRIEVSPFIAPDGFGDAELWEALSHWPQLEHLTLDHHDVINPPPSPFTLLGIHAASQQCPKLAYLALSCQGEDVPGNDKVPPHPSLTFWNLEVSSIKSGNRVGVWMCRAFPRLQTAEYIRTLRWFFHFPEEEWDVESATDGRYLEYLAMVAEWGAARILHKSRVPSAT